MVEELEYAWAAAFVPLMAGRLWEPWLEREIARSTIDCRSIAGSGTVQHRRWSNRIVSCSLFVCEADFRSRDSIGSTECSTIVYQRQTVPVRTTTL